jgi:hypothetical protein
MKEQQEQSMSEKTLRDEFAMAAFPSMFADMRGFPEGWELDVATQAYRIADAMMEARKGVKTEAV